jgi:hypothetical protein
MFVFALIVSRTVLISTCVSAAVPWSPLIVLFSVAESICRSAVLSMISSSQSWTCSFATTCRAKCLSFPLQATGREVLWRVSCSPSAHHYFLCFTNPGALRSIIVSATASHWTYMLSNLNTVQILFLKTGFNRRICIRFFQVVTSHLPCACYMCAHHIIVIMSGDNREVPAYFDWQIPKHFEKFFFSNCPASVI